MITMDADLQDSPDEIPELFKMITQDGFDLVSGYKEKRHDPITKTVPTKLFNWATRKMSGIKLRDFNCGLKSYRSQVIKSIEVYGEMHRFIPVYANSVGAKILEVPVRHHARKFGKSKYGLERTIKVILDLIAVQFLTRAVNKPIYLFGGGGFILIAASLIGD